MSLTAHDAACLQECLAGEGIAVLPTDTVYGLACNPESAPAIERLYELKRRPARKPSAVMFFSIEAAFAALPELGVRTRAALAALLPGPVTLLLPNSHGRFPLACGSRAGAPLGVRVPLFDGPLAALVRVTAPALQSSANLSGAADPRRLSDVPPVLREGADLTLDGGELPGTASTVVDLTSYEQDGACHVVREGAIPAKTLRGMLIEATR
jgi:L-threonylcarbamoyladenylate synthase